VVLYIETMDGMVCVYVLYAFVFLFGKWHQTRQRSREKARGNHGEHLL